MNKTKSHAALLFIALLVPLVSAAVTFPEKPPSKDYFVDKAKVINQTAAKKINAIAADLLAKKKIPLFVVTINSLTEQAAAGYSIEQYATKLFNHWGIGSQQRNYGMLLLVSVNDRKARIELGAGWGHRYDSQAQQVMRDLMIPAFKREDYARGLADGARGLKAMAYGLGLPTPTAPWWFLPLVIGALVLIIVIIVNLFKTGRKGWAWALIIGLGILIIVILRAMAESRGSSGGFGGGSSGGGGATGSW